MNNLREQIKSLPSKAITKVLKKTLALPAPTARFIINDVAQLRKHQVSWIHKVKLDPGSQQDWSGCWIGENIKKLSTEQLLQRVEKADIIIFYVHGGGFRVGSSTMYTDANISWLQTLKRDYNLNAMIMSIDYRLAPEYRYPSAIEDVLRAYEYLTKSLCIDSEKIIVAGDQTGGSLLLEMLFVTHDPSMFEISTGEDSYSAQPIVPELPRPAGTVLISPLVTDQMTSESWKTNKNHDYITEAAARVTAKEYYDPIQTRDEIDEESTQRKLGILDLQSGFKEFLSNNLLLYAGNLEVLRDDILLLASKAEADGVNCRTVVENYVHNWFCVRMLVKDKEVLRRADIEFAKFCFEATGGAEKKRHSSSFLSKNLSLEEDTKETDDENLSSLHSDSDPSSQSVIESLNISGVSLFEGISDRQSVKKDQSFTTVPLP